MNWVFIETPHINNLPQYHPMFINYQKYTRTEGFGKDIVFNKMDKWVNRKCKKGNRVSKELGF